MDATRLSKMEPHSIPYNFEQNLLDYGLSRDQGATSLVEELSSGRL
jgi:hypothetical protein